MEVSQISNLLKPAKAATHDDRRQQPKRQPPKKKTDVPSGSVYTPDGRLDEESGSKLDVVA